MMSVELIKKYYDAFNREDLNAFLDLLADDVIHDINQGECEQGKAAFKKFMEKAFQFYKETVRDLIIFDAHNQKNFAAEFSVIGIYKKTAPKLPRAEQQKYTLKAGAFFEVENNKISRISNYYNVYEWLKQVS